MSGSVPNTTDKMSVRAHIGDAKTLLAFDLLDTSRLSDLAGFTIWTKPGSGAGYYLWNSFVFETPANHAQDPKERPNSSINAPFHKFRWLHVPGKDHQGRNPFRGTYTYTVTARFFDDNASLEPLDPAWSVSVDVDVVPFERQGLAVSFTRGFVQSQAFVHHFGVDGEIVPPAGSDLLFDTTAEAGTISGRPYTFGDEWTWSGFTARERIFSLLQTVVDDTSLQLDVLAYDLDEPDILRTLLDLAAQGRVRVVLDNSTEHHSAAGTLPEDQFAQRFTNARAGNDTRIQRGHFGRFAHDKILIVRTGGESYQATDTVRAVLTGSTNFSVTGMYVNANHVIVFDNAAVGAQYAALFEAIWNAKVKTAAFKASGLAGQSFSFAPPPIDITFAPHTGAFAKQTLADLAARVVAEGAKPHGGSVLFAVMSIRDPATAKGSNAAAGPDDDTNPVYAALKGIHEDQTIVSYGVTDDSGGISLYKPGSGQGLLVSGLPGQTQLPAPFDQVPPMKWHQIHHKFVVCGFNGDDPVVYCGSSNLAVGGEQVNGDNLLAIHDEDVATAFAIEALALVDHFETLDSNRAGTPPPATPHQSYPFEFTTSAWAKEFFDPHDLHYADRLLFA
jgi:phosphatidylserine/phosphatidylglycerophosphate/cardiolipin synthase-like enzyme